MGASNIEEFGHFVEDIVVEIFDKVHQIMMDNRRLTLCKIGSTLCIRIFIATVPVESTGLRRSCIHGFLLVGKNMVIVFWDILEIMFVEYYEIDKTISVIQNASLSDQLEIEMSKKYPQCTPKFF